MLRTIAKSVAEAVAIVVGAVLCLLLTTYVVERDSFEIGPLLLLALYPLPIGIATLRKHNAVLDIAITNLWLGWTVIGWVFALVWACDTDVEEDFE
jgi:FtsH-binding integral membrane protein